MVEITPEMVRIIVELVSVAISGIFGVILGSWLTYVYAIKKGFQERLLTERVALYRPLVNTLASLHAYMRQITSTKSS